MKFIKNHPIWTSVIICFILCFIDGYHKAEYNIQGYCLLCLFILACISPYIRKVRKSKIQKENDTSVSQLKEIKEEPETESNDTKYISCYQKRYLLTKNEYYEFKKLKEFAIQKSLIICPKVRLLDLLEPRKSAKNYKTLFYKIQAKHVDFVICDQNLYVKAILELDDNSHSQKEREERDQFVDLILKDVGYKVIRTKYITEETLQDL